ncbi:hypothetical protein H0H81_010336 [Sphagnurus paluster]|uniref:Uncharacterized protein n=1 Tax=Sphagnurus paluster TaxID=117069 RepID=A0A9P7K2K7_9AGAR|nr:hypothetical protein H0H81_010336 [Sphagnurus paluster]
MAQSNNSIASTQDVGDRSTKKQRRRERKKKEQEKDEQRVLDKEQKPIRSAQLPNKSGQGQHDAKRQQFCDIESLKSSKSLDDQYYDMERQLERVKERNRALEAELAEAKTESDLLRESAHVMKSKLSKRKKRLKRTKLECENFALKEKLAELEGSRESGDGSDDGDDNSSDCGSGEDSWYTDSDKESTGYSDDEWEIDEPAIASYSKVAQLEARIDKLMKYGKQCQPDVKDLQLIRRRIVCEQMKLGLETMYCKEYPLIPRQSFWDWSKKIPEGGFDAVDERF